MKKRVIFNVCLMLVLFCSIVYAGEAALTPIMGESAATAEQMYLYLVNRNEKAGLNPVSDEYAREFAATVMEEAAAEGVRADVAFALMMHETGFLNFGGDVLAVQNNFGGIGATGGGEPGAEFADMQLGIRAVVQHLKCYASSEPLSGELADPRFADYLRGKAEYVQWLGRADNPSGYGWAVPGKGYGYRLVEMISEMAALDASEVGSIDGSDAENEAEEGVSSKVDFSALTEGGLINFAIAAALLFIVAAAFRRA